MRVSAKDFARRGITWLFNQSAWGMLRGSYSPPNIDGPKSPIPSSSSSDNDLGSGTSGSKSMELPRINLFFGKFISI